MNSNDLPSGFVHVPEGIWSQNIGYQGVTVEVPRVTAVVPDMTMDEAIVPYIFTDSAVQEMETVKSLLSQSGFRTEVCSLHG